MYLFTETASIAGTKKTIADNALSLITGMDCSTVDHIYKDKKYCQKIKPRYEYKPVKTAYCYKSIAKVDCYTEPSKNKNDILTGTYTY